jgi:hypothetical protein
MRHAYAWYTANDSLDFVGRANRAPILVAIVAGLGQALSRFR